MKKILIMSACAVLALGMDVVPVEKREFSASKFIPDISLVLDASYVDRSIKDDEIAHLELDGVAHGLYGSHSHDGHDHASYNGSNGFNLNYAELVLSSSVDPYFEMNGVFHYSEGGVEIEEAYITSTALDYGIRARAGKFNSNFGYLNEQHHHTWDFNDMPLVYEGFLGMHGINEKGLQLQYTAPTDLYLMIGFEALQGENEQMFGNSTIGDVEDPIAKGRDGATLYIAYAKTAFDIGDSSILTGISYADGISRIDHTTDEEPHAFAGDSKLYGFDFTLKHYFDSYSFFKLQTEVLYRDMDGKQYNLDANGLITSQPNLTKEQAGAYVQAIYAPNKNWSMGARYDSIFKNDVTANGTDMNKKDALDKYSVMAEYKTSEFARFRLQYNSNKSLVNEDGKRVNLDSVIFSANISIGAHGAHAF
ncbi:hypothetical protein [Sulfurimonas sp.]|uniref:hypothetical protein n=1 Tax=Sulfurimonas sp. TaxID=2022749 RepID=UPI00356AF0D4